MPPVCNRQNLGAQQSSSITYEGKYNEDHSKVLRGVGKILIGNVAEKQVLIFAGVKCWKSKQAGNEEKH